MLKSIHTYWGLFVFNFLFVLLFPFLLIPILVPSQFHLTGIINRWWAKLLFTFIFVPFKVEERSHLDRKRKYIFCANHFSYLDIPAMGLNPVNAIFVGKSDMGKVKVIFHEPIETNDLGLDDVSRLKTEVFKVIDSELKQQNA